MYKKKTHEGATEAKTNHKQDLKEDRVSHTVGNDYKLIGKKTNKKPKKLKKKNKPKTLLRKESEEGKRRRATGEKKGRTGDRREDQRKAERR